MKARYPAPSAPAHPRARAWAAWQPAAEIRGVGDEGAVGPSPGDRCRSGDGPRARPHREGKGAGPGDASRGQEDQVL